MRAPNPLTQDLPDRAPAILAMLCMAAGWTQHELRQAIAYNRAHGFLHTITAIYPRGFPTLPRDFPEFEVRLQGDFLCVVIKMEGVRVACAGRESATMTIPVILPESVMASLCGRRSIEVVEHKLLASPAFVITSMTRAAWHNHTTITFTMPEYDFPA